MNVAAATRALLGSSELPQTKRVGHPVARLRPKELHRLFWQRHGATFPADDTGARDAIIMLDHIVQGADADRQATIFLQRRCPWMQPAAQAEAIAGAFERRRFWDKSELGNVFGLTWEERDQCRITTIRPAGATDADMDERRKMKNTAAKGEKRRLAALHPEQKKPLPMIRAEVIAGILRPGERCTVKAISDELNRTRATRFASLSGQALKTAIHNAIDCGVEAGLFRKVIEPGLRMPVAWIIKTGGAT